MPQTMRRHLVRLVLLPATALLVGCGGTPIVAHDAGSLESPIEAPSDGRYTLHQKFPPTAVKGPIELRKGDPVGFQTAETGRINVVAGAEIWTFEDADLVWKRED